MNTSELEEILKKIDHTKNTFGSVYPSELLPLEVKQYPQSFVANFDTSEKPGIYWVADCFIDDQHGEFFDSYGLLPHRYTKYFEEFLNKNAAQWTYNWKHLQSSFTDVSGHHCIFYIYNRCHTVKTNTTVYVFPSKVKEDNDASVRYFVERKLVVKPGFHKANYDHDNDQFRVKTKQLA